jgi:hypothetical protein
VGHVSLLEGVNNPKCNTSDPPLPRSLSPPRRTNASDAGGRCSYRRNGALSRTIPVCDYCIVTSRVEHRPKAELTLASLREPLPQIDIPLGDSDSDASLDLQAIVHRIYDVAGYGYYVYSQPPDPPLSDADREWAEKLLSEQR